MFSVEYKGNKEAEKRSECRRAGTVSDDSRVMCVVVLCGWRRASRLDPPVQKRRQVMDIDKARALHSLSLYVLVQQYSFSQF